MKHILLFFSFFATVFSFSQQKISIYFSFDSFEVKESSKEKLNIFSTENNFKNIRLVSYTDIFGSNSYNKILAEKRLQEVEKLLISKGNTIEKKEIIGESYAINNFEKSISDYKLWRKVDVFFEQNPIIEEIKPIVENIKENEKFGSLLEDDNTKTVTLDVKFYGGSDEMFPESFTDLISFYNFLDKNQSIRVLIRGHVCCMSDYDLSVARAYAVRNFLISKGIKSSRIEHKGFNNTMPVVFPEITDFDRQMNRRVDVVILK